MFFWFLGLGVFCWDFLGLHEGISGIVKGNVRKQGRFCQKRANILHLVSLLSVLWHKVEFSGMSDT